MERNNRKGTSAHLIAEGIPDMKDPDPKVGVRRHDGMQQSMMRDPDHAFNSYMIRRPNAKKLGTHLLDWLTICQEHGIITQEKAKEQINQWLERNQAALTRR